jgi:MFS family permease
MQTDLSLVTVGDETHAPISWSAIFAGAVSAIAVAMLLSSLAAGFGLKMAAPWPSAAPASGAFTPIAGALLVAIQVLSAALGGYLAGRLRTRWANVHEHETHFRDTAHGLITWAVATVGGALLIVAVMPQDAAATAAAVALQADPLRAANLAAQMSFFMAVGLLLSAFVAAVAAAIGGLRREEMYGVLRQRR